ncbi:MAG: metal-dependent transcriptional regulator [Oscillospiraceae bacterium]|nr:metal-dependent transcriptional regulator [Oscillospiraceae bacterium]
MRKSHESSEDYLETILTLKKELGHVRSIDIAQKMNFSKPSISRAMGLLREKGCIIVDKDGYIELTAEGLEIANRVYNRHLVLTNFLCYLGVDEETADEDACRMEHYLSDQSFEKINELAKKLMDSK